MSLKDINQLIEEARNAASELDYSETTGISQDEVLRLLNQGQNKIYRRIISKSQKLFSTNKEIPVEIGQKMIAMPKDIYAQNRITDVKYLSDGCIYQVLLGSKKNDLQKRNSVPTRYYRQNNKVVLVPAPYRAGTIDLSYIKKLPTLGFKSGSVASVTLTDNKVTSLFLNISTDEINSEELNKLPRFTVVDSEGNIKMSNIKYTEINSATGEITVDPNWSFDLGETIDVSDIVVAGALASTHSGLEEDVEEFIVEYAVLKMLQKQGSAEVTTQISVLQDLNDDIMDVYGKIDDDIAPASIIDDDSQDFDF